MLPSGPSVVAQAFALRRLILFCRIVVIGVTLALPACTDFKKDFLCRPDGICVNASPGHTGVGP
jgi:hypothetical protein